MVRCKVVNCHNTTYRTQKKNLNILFHSFPKDLHLRDIWLNNCGYDKDGSKVTHHWFVCSIHFDENDYDIRINNKCIEKVLKPTAIPTHNLNYLTVHDTVDNCRNNVTNHEHHVNGQNVYIKNEEKNENLMLINNETYKNHVEIASDNATQILPQSGGVPIMLVNQDGNVMSIIKGMPMNNLITINGEQYQLTFNQEQQTQELMETQEQQEPENSFINSNSNNILIEQQQQQQNQIQLYQQQHTLLSLPTTTAQINQHNNLVLYDYPTLLHINDNPVNNLPFNLIQPNTTIDNISNNKEPIPCTKLITTNKPNVIHISNNHNDNEYLTYNNNNQNTIITNKSNYNPNPNQNNKKKLRINNEMMEVKPISEKLLKTKLIEVESVNIINSNKNDIKSINNCNNNNNNNNNKKVIIECNNSNKKCMKTTNLSTLSSSPSSNNEIDFEDFIPTFQIIDNSSINNIN